MEIANEERTLVETDGCVDCTEKEKRRFKTRFEKKFTLRARQKLRAMKAYQDAIPGFKGCGAGCPCDFVAIKNAIYRVLHAKLLGDEPSIQKRMEIILAAMLEWDHNDPLKKCRNVSHIWDDAK